MAADDAGQLKVRLDVNVKRRLRMAAIASDLTMSEIVARALDEFFDGPREHVGGGAGGGDAPGPSSGSATSTPSTEPIEET